MLFNTKWGLDIVNDIAHDILNDIAIDKVLDILTKNDLKNPKNGGGSVLGLARKLDILECHSICHLECHFRPFF